MKHLFLSTLLILTSFVVVKASDNTVTITPSQWKTFTRVKGKTTENTLLLNEIGNDCHITSVRVNIDPQKLNTVTFTYRAKGTSSQRGQLYFEKKGKPVSAASCWNLPALKADGGWHTVTLTEKDLYAPKLFREGGNITYLRIDPTDGPGGEIELKEMNFSYSLQKKALPEQTFNEVIVPSQWKYFTRVKGKLAGKSLLLNEIGNDCHIASVRVDIDPQKLNTVVFTYRAKGTSSQRGQLYFEKKGKPVSAASCWNLPVLKADGKWHTVTLTEKDLHSPELFRKGGNITGLRFDPTDGPGGEIELQEMKFSWTKPEKPLPKQTFKLDASPWPVLKTAYLGVDKSEAMPYFKCKMIFSPDDPKTSGQRRCFFLRREFELKEVPQHAWLQFAADDSAYAFANGVRVSRNANWRKPSCADIAGKLKTGKNVLAFQYWNSDFAGGVFGELCLIYKDGRFERIPTDSLFRTSVKEEKNWAKPGFDASSWKKVVTHPGPPVRPWLTQLDYRDFTRVQTVLTSSIAPKNAEAGKKVQVHFEFSGKIPAIPFNTEIKLVTGEKLLWFESFSIRKEMIKKQSADRWTLDFEYTMPLYLSSRENVELQLSSPDTVTADGKFPSVVFNFKQASAIPGYKDVPRMQVKNIPGYGPSFVLNGTPVYALWGGVSSYNINNRRISGAPFNFVTVHNKCQEWWPEPGKFDPVDLDRNAELFRRANPDAWFIWDITLRMPAKWAKLHPDQMCRDEKGEIPRDGVCFSFSSEEAKKELREILDKVLAYLEKAPYRNRIVAYRVNAGHTIEWLHWDPKGGRSVDFSEPSKAAFRKFAEKHYPSLQNFAVPGYLDLSGLENGELLQSPGKNLWTTAYMDYLSNSVADLLIDLNSRAKAFLKGQKAVGTYYGYTMTLNENGRSQYRAHYALKKVLDSGAVDFLMSPQPYNLRDRGDVYGEMKPFASLMAHHILAVQEDDTRTHHGIPGMGYRQTHNEAATIEVMRRGMSFSLCRQQPGYYYALADKRMLDFPALDRDMALMLKTGSFCVKNKTGRHAEIAVVTSEKSVAGSPIYTQTVRTGEISQAYRPDGTVRTFRDGGAVIDYEIHGQLMNRIARAGAPVDYLLAEDLKDNPGNYKLYIFVNAFNCDEKFVEAVRKLQNRPGTTLCWLYAPGYYQGISASTENMKKLTGFTFQKASAPMVPAVKLADNRWMGTLSTRVSPLFSVTGNQAEILGKYEDGTTGLALMNNGKSRSVFYGGWQLDVPFLKKLVRESGVRTYTENDDPVEANDSLIAFHARFAGKKTIVLPKKTDVLDVFNKKMIGKKIDRFSFDAPIHSSLLFYYGDDASELLKQLN